MKRLLLLAVSTVILISCKDIIEEKDPNIFYTCSMDPQVMEKRPGKCPICKMDLTKTVVTPNKRDNSLRLSDTQIKLANIKTKEIKSTTIAENIQFRGTVVPDGRKVDVISSRVSGRIEKLYFKEKGKQINVGDKLYEIYSEELQTAIKQYMMLKEKAGKINGNSVNYNQMLKSAQDKLILWGLSEKQINNLNPSEQRVAFYSNKSGVVTDITLAEGDYISEGEIILTVSDYSYVWVEAEIYSENVKSAHHGEKVDVIVEAFPNEKIEGTISFENPELKSQTQFSLVRIEIFNKEKKIKPGMRAIVTLRPDAVPGISIPESALLYEQGMNFVWVNNKKGEYIRRPVETGKKANGMIEIKSGVKAGEQIVVSGLYLLNSEYLLRNNAPITFGRKEDNSKESMPVHKH